MGTNDVMEPIAETEQIFEELEKYGYVDNLRAELGRRADAVKVLVPELVGLSLAALEDGVAFTMVATDADVAVLDAIQYLVAGPCVDAADTGQVLDFRVDEAEDERRWQTFARATAAKAVASTLTLPVQDGDRVVGSINLYAASTGAFGGLHPEIAAIFGAWAPGAITNADLSFQTRRTAERAPEALRVTMRVETAVGVLMEAESVDADTARGLLDEAAQRAGVPTEELADAVLELFEAPGER
jgi:GAF domain-containing protein